MGHGVAKVLVENNFKVLTFLRGRSKRTLKLANEARVINIDNFENRMLKQGQLKQKMGLEYVFFPQPEH